MNILWKQVLIYLLIVASVLKPEAMEMNMEEREACVEEWLSIADMSDSMAKNNAYLWSDRELVDYNIVDYTDKKVVFLGDSLTYGRGNLPEDSDMGDGVTYCDMLADILGLTDYANVSVCGNAVETKTSPNITELYEKIPADTDIFIFMLGYNDYFYEAINRGDIENFNKDCDDTLCYLKEVYPNADIFVITEPKNLSEEWYHGYQYPDDNVDYEDFVDMIIDKAEKNDIPVFDLYHEGFMNNHDTATARALYNDTVHPNKTGYRYLAYHIAAHLTNYYSLDYILGLTELE